MKIVLLGKNGQLGLELQRSLSGMGELHCFGRDDLDLTNLPKVREIIGKIEPKFIVNASAYTAVDRAEIEYEQAAKVNVDVVRVLAEESKRLNATLIQYSTDYVFDGDKVGAYSEIDAPNPLSVYGKTKYEGEQAIIKTGCSYLIFRCSWIFSIFGHNFPNAILRRAQYEDSIKVVSDVFGAPTSASFIADASALVLYALKNNKNMASECSGIYHLTSSGKVSWYEYALYLIDRASRKGVPMALTPNKIFPIKASEFVTNAKRPQNCCLDTTHISETFGLVMPSWESQLNRYLYDLSRVLARSL